MPAKYQVHQRALYTLRLNVVNTVILKKMATTDQKTACNQSFFGSGTVCRFDCKVIGENRGNSDQNLRTAI